MLKHSEKRRCDTCLSCQGPFLRTGPRQQQVPHHHLIAHLVDSDETRNVWECEWELGKDLDSKQKRGQFVAVRCFAVHIHIDRDQEQ